MDGEEGQEDPDAPHTEKRVIKGLYGISDSIENSFQNNEDTKKRFRYGNHPKDNCSKLDDLPVTGKNGEQLRRKQEEERARDTHDNKNHDDQHPGQFMQTLLVFCADRISGKGCGCGLHSVSGDIKGLLYSKGNGVCCKGDGTKACHKRSKNNVTEAGRHALHGNGEANTDTGLQDFTLWFQGASFGRNKPVAI